MIKGVFFDLGGTLYTYRNIPNVTAPLLSTAIEKADLAAPKGEIKKAFLDATSLAIQEYSSKSYYLHESFFLSVFDFFMKQLGGITDNELRTWYVKNHRESIINALEPKADCVSLLKALNEAGIYTSIVSNIDQDMLEPLIARDKLNAYLNHWTSSETVRSCKPDEKIFRHAIKISKLREEEILFVGDSPEHDIAGASHMGLATVLITDGGMPPPLQSGRQEVRPDFTIKNLDEIKKILSL